MIKRFNGAGIVLTTKVKSPDGKETMSFVFARDALDLAKMTGYKKCKGHFLHIGGSMDKDTDPVVVASKELFEETAGLIQITPESLQQYRFFDFPKRTRNGTLIYRMYFIEIPIESLEKFNEKRKMMWDQMNLVPDEADRVPYHPFLETDLLITLPKDKILDILRDLPKTQAGNISKPVTISNPVMDITLGSFTATLYWKIFGMSTFIKK
jgi:ADP-ribose pyrophosphatase YjhB (NUDIX family)